MKKPTTYLFVFSFIFGIQYALAENKSVESLNSQQSVLWRVSGQDLAKPSYIFGTWHFLCRNEIIFKDKVKRAISQSEQLLIQNFITYLSGEDYFERQQDNKRIQKGTPIYQLDDRKKRKQLLKLIKKNLDLKIDHAKRIKFEVKRMTPIEVYFTSMHSFINDCGGLGSFDSLLYDHFTKNQAAVGALNDRKSFMESLLFSDFVNVDSLITYLENIESQRAMVKQMKAHYYLDENLVELEKLYKIFLNNDFTDPDLIDQYIFSMDVTPWVNLMTDWMAKKPTFITVNASYLQGDGGVIEQLKARGYVVEPIN